MGIRSSSEIFSEEILDVLVDTCCDIHHAIINSTNVQEKNICMPFLMAKSHSSAKNLSE